MKLVTHSYIKSACCRDLSRFSVFKSRICGTFFVQKLAGIKHDVDSLNHKLEDFESKRR